MTTILDASELRSWMREERRFTLIDVLPEEYFNAQRLPGARRACVYEVNFLDQIKALGLGSDEPLVLYGAGHGSLDSAVAAEKLERAGFRQIYDLRDGRAAWAQAGGPFEGDGALPSAPRAPEDRTYSVDPDKSTLEWIGRNLNSTQRGTLRIGRGDLVIAGGELADGYVVLDMRSIQNTDIAEPEMRQLLEAHLKSDDFFDVERYPTAGLKMVSAKPLPNATPGAPNYEVMAELTVKDSSRPITFPAIVSLGADGALTAVAQIEMDRTQWNVLYGSGRFFKMLGKHLVNDAITLLVKIIAG